MRLSLCISHVNSHSQVRLNSRRKVQSSSFSLRPHQQPAGGTLTTTSAVTTYFHPDNNHLTLIMIVSIDMYIVSGRDVRTAFTEGSRERSANER